MSSGSKQHERPNLSGLALAVDPTGQFTVPEGGYVVIDRMTHCFKEDFWKDTRVFKVKRVNRITGDLLLWDVVREQCAMSNYVTARTLGDELYVFPDDRDPHGDLTGLSTVKPIDDDNGCDDEALAINDEVEQ